MVAGVAVFVCVGNGVLVGDDAGVAVFVWGGNGVLVEARVGVLVGLVVFVAVEVGKGVPLPLIISIPFTFGLSHAPLEKPTVICPLALAVVENCLMSALFAAPMSATMSKFVKTGVPLMATLN